METYVTIADFLKVSSPYGIVAILGWAFWRVSEKKDQEVKELYEKVAQISEAQVVAITKVEAALIGLREAIDELRGKNLVNRGNGSSTSTSLHD